MLNLFRKVMCMALTLIIAFYFQQHYFSDAYWLILSAFFGVALQNKYYYSFPTLSLLCTALLASLVMLAANIFSYNVYVYSLFLIIVTYFSASFGYEQRRYWQHSFILVLYAVLSGVLLTNFNGTVSRFGEIWIGFLIAIVVRKGLSAKSEEANRELIKEILLASNAYLHSIFAAMLKKDYASQSFHYEKTFHACRHNLLEKLIYLHQVLQDDEESVYQNIEAQLGKLYENILSLGNILLRIDDVSIFEMASKEFSSMAETTEQTLKSLARFKQPKNLDDLSYQIQQLQDVNMSGVQLVAQDPLLFFLFIEDWKLLERRFELIATEINSLEVSHAATENIATNHK